VILNVYWRHGGQAFSGRKKFKIGQYGTYVYNFGQEFFACLNKIFQELAQKFEFMRELLITETGNTLNDETR
jgi:hypothetical protein